MGTTKAGRRAGVLAAALAAFVAGNAGAASLAGCVPGHWYDPTSGAERTVPAVVEDMASRPAVLLGERHDEAEQHRWQLYALAALYGRRPDMAIGLEMLPRRVQPALDAWVAGDLSVEELLARTDWLAVWGFDPDLYLPLFHFARQNRIPMIALNVERALVARVGRDGWAQVPVEAREGIGDPAAPPDAYVDRLADAFAMSAGHRGGGKGAAGAGTDDSAPARDDPDFRRFVEAQITWDRAMAEALAAARVSPGGGQRLVVGLVGAGHAAFGTGVAYQLAALGVPDTGVALPVDGCDDIEAGMADAVFVLGPWRAAEPSHPLLGVMIAPGEGGVAVNAVSDGSVAAGAGVKAGDVIVSAAGRQVRLPGELVEIVHRQAPGTWLPLVLRRSGGEVPVVAKFPAGS